MAVKQEAGSAATLSVLEGLERFAASKKLEKRKTTMLTPSKPRLLVLSVIPLLLSVMLAMQALDFYRTIPAAEGPMRAILVGVCGSVACLAFALPVLVLSRFWGGAIQVRSNSLIVQRGTRSRTYRYEDISVGFMVGRPGMRTVTICTPDGFTTVNEILYPKLYDTWMLMSNRATSAKANKF